MACIPTQDPEFTPQHHKQEKKCKNSLPEVLKLTSGGLDSNPSLTVLTSYGFHNHQPTAEKKKNPLAQTEEDMQAVDGSCSKPSITYRCHEAIVSHKQYTLFLLKFHRHSQDTF